MPKDIELGVRLTADGKGFVGAVTVSGEALDRFTGRVKRVDAATRRMTRTTGLAAASARRTGQAFLEAHGSMARYLSFGGAFYALSRSIGAVYSATVRQEQALAQVEARIRSTGGAAGVTAAEVAELAAALQDATTFGDEEILEVQSVLLSFRNIAGEALEEATKQVLNLSAGLNQDLRSAAIQLGKALDDPARGLDALSRSGTTFTQAQKDVIRSLHEAGQAGEAQAIILRELEVLYGGAAEAKARTLGGAVERLGAAFGDLLEVQTDSTEGMRQWIEAARSGLRSIDPSTLNALHRILGSVAVAAGVAAAAFVGRWGVALLLAGTRTAWATTKTRTLALAHVGAAAKVDVARLRMLAGAQAARRYGGALRVASVSARTLGRSLAVLGGPAGVALLAAYAVYEFAAANKDAKDSLKGLPEDVDAFRDALKGLGDAELRQRRRAIQAEIDAIKQEFEAADRELERLRRPNAVTERDFAGSASNYSPGARASIQRDATQEERDDAEAEVERLGRELRIRQRKLQEVNDAEDALRRPKTTAKTTDRRPDEEIDRDLAALRQAARTDLERLNAEHAARIRLLDEEQDRTGAANQGLRDWADAQLRAGKASLDRRREDERLRSEQERLRSEQETGLPALEALRASNAELAGVTDFSAAAIARRAEMARFAAEVEREYETATRATKDALIDELAAEQALLRAQGLRAEVLARLRRDDEDYAERQRAVLDLRDNGQISDDEAARELEDMRRERALESWRAIHEEELRQASIQHDALYQQEVEHLDRMSELRLSGSQRALGIAQGFNRLEVLSKKAAAGDEKDIRLQQARTALDITRQGAASLAVFSKKFFRLQQAAAIGQATINIAQGVTAAWKKGIPLGPIEAALILAAGAAEIATIRSQRPPQGFALGGVVDSPTWFAARGVPSGVAGEAGPEAILPLRRLPGGELGVRSAGGQPRTVTVAPRISIEMHVGGGAEGVELAGEEAAARAAEAVRSVIADEQRPGGLLNRTDVA